MKTDRTDDPLADTEPAACTTCDGPCPCAKCHGVRWVQVQPGYAERAVPDPTPEALAALAGDEAAIEALFAEVARARAAAANTWYPCRECNRTAFFRWAGGHWGRDHDPSDCADCHEAMGRRGARSAARALHANERRDLR